MAGVPEDKMPSLDLIYEKYTADWQVMYKSFGVNFSEDDIWRIYHEVADSERAPLSPGIVEFLNQLKRKGLKLAIVSHSQKEKIKKLLEKEKLESYFDYIWGGFVDKTGKVLEVYEQLKTKPEKVLFIGDMQPEIEAGEKAGCDVAIIIPIPKDREIPFHPKPKYYVHSYPELAEKIGL